jgi:dihydroneopterin aldolase
MNALSQLSPTAYEHLSVFVRGLTIAAEVGVHPHERGKTQPLILDVELSLSGPVVRPHLKDTLNYETIVTAAKALAQSGHIELVEIFAERLGRQLLLDARVASVRVRVEKPEALQPHAQAAGCEIVICR